MHIRLLFLMVTVASVLWSSPASPITDIQYNNIQALGALNGIALQCKYYQETQRMKKALVSILPKRRQLGQVFDDATNESFLAFIKQAASCPDEAEFEHRVDAAIHTLENSFSGK
jgi:hypothetical protein